MEFTTIILSGLPLSGKTTLAQRLSEFYGWPVYSIGQLWREQWKRIYPHGEVSFEDYWRSTSLEDNLRVNQNARTIFERGNVIGDTRFMMSCADLPALFVFVTADLDTRARRGMTTERYHEKSFGNVREILRAREADEVQMGHSLYGKEYDYRDPCHYHLTLHSGRLSVDEEVMLIRSMIEHPLRAQHPVHL